jgi:DNA (cytosine-5)-methyltransferase 1
MNWRPIETAPKDGTKVLLLLKDSDVPHAGYYKHRYGWRIAWDNHDLSEYDGPTHWMPLPPPPSTEPAPTTVAGGGGKTGMVSASIAVYHGTEEDGHGCDEPGHTATTRGRLGLIEAQRSAAAMLTPQELAGARRVAAFLREHGVEFEGEFAMVRTPRGNFVIVDLGMRMLTPRELFRAQGFPDDYVIDRAWLIDPLTGDITERPLTKEQQIRMCGNSVCPPVSEALVRANVPELCHGYPSIKLARKGKALAV